MDYCSIVILLILPNTLIMRLTVSLLNWNCTIDYHFSFLPVTMSNTFLILYCYAESILSSHCVFFMSFVSLGLFLELPTDFISETSVRVKPPWALRFLATEKVIFLLVRISCFSGSLFTLVGGESHSRRSGGAWVGFLMFAGRLVNAWDVLMHSDKQWNTVLYILDKITADIIICFNFVLI